jgi:microfibrillar-associated protein 1
MMDYFVANSSLAPAPMGIQSTAGAVPIKNDKGKIFRFEFMICNMQNA